MDLFDCNVSGKCYTALYQMSFAKYAVLWPSCPFCFLQALAIIAFYDGKLNLNTFKTLLSVGPTFAVMNFLESKPLNYVMLFCLCCLDFLILYFYSLPCLLIFFNGACCLVLGGLDVVLMFGAYTSARGMAISRLVIRFIWCGLSSVFVLYVYL